MAFVREQCTAALVIIIHFSHTWLSASRPSPFARLDSGEHNPNETPWQSTIPSSCSESTRHLLLSLFRHSSLCATCLPSTSKTSSCNIHVTPINSLRIMYHTHAITFILNHWTVSQSRRPVISLNPSSEFAVAHNNAPPPFRDSLLPRFQ